MDGITGYIRGACLPDDSPKTYIICHEVLYHDVLVQIRILVRSVMRRFWAVRQSPLRYGFKLKASPFLFLCRIFATKH